ncbi:MAG: hypothetical protein OQK82_08250 [Candidatus Pacearchaeota archaeon]|nr:hypothetical protein [Candidatus Pacearchaeota archaeon]
MGVKLISILAITICLMPFFSATTVLEIQTFPGYEIYISAINPVVTASNDFIKEPIKTFTGEYGQIKIEYDIDDSTFDLGLLLKDGAKTVIPFTRFGKYVKDTTINITFLPEGTTIENLNLPAKEIPVETEIVENISNEINQTEMANESLRQEPQINITEDTNQTGIIKGVLLNGYAIYENNHMIFDIMTYLIGASVLGVPIYMLAKKRKKKKGEKEGIIEGEDELSKAEAKLKEAKEKVESLKGNKIDEVKKRLIEDEKELMRLRAQQRKKKKDKKD